MALGVTHEVSLGHGCAMLAAPDRDAVARKPLGLAPPSPSQLPSAPPLVYGLPWCLLRPIPWAASWFRARSFVP